MQSLSIISSVFTIFICGACIWFLVKVKENHELGLYDEDNQKGLNAFIRALWVWIIAALVGIWGTEFLKDIDKTAGFWTLGAILSIFNSAFLLIAIPFIQVNESHPLEFVKAKTESKHVWLYSIIFIIITLLLGLLVGMDGLNIIPQPERFISFFEMLFALFVVWHLIFRMIQAFTERNLKSMIPIAWFTIGLIVFAEIFYSIPAFLELGTSGLEEIDLSAKVAIISYKTLLIFLILILVLSWQVKKHRDDLNKAEKKLGHQEDLINMFPDPEEVVSPEKVAQLTFHSPTEKDPSISLKIGNTILNIPFNQQAKQRFKNLLLLAIHRKYADSPENQSVELDPQEAKRIRESIARELGMLLIKADTSQNQTGLYHLGIKPENIEFPPLVESFSDQKIEEIAELTLKEWGFK